ncbi:MAG: aminotransferase class I/II-fold pyridoxal phosphate-dependent enzyme [Candidatus Omnitrophica bacterium]|nr:aminotransferase class I/II-fold pyridoxal phosphate-dependent enzyme [Candidatus Omnitrophota bacterium]
MFLKVISPRKVTVEKHEIINILTLLFQGKLIKGNCIEQFENKFKDYIGAKFALAVPSGRLGLKLILESCNLEKGDEILIPAYTFHIVPKVVKKAGFTPVFVDINEEDYNIDVNRIEEKITPRTRVIIATHLFGKACELNAILKIAQEHNLFVIEDCAQAIGAEYYRRKVGSFGNCAYFSFETVKPFHTFGGGMIVTNNHSLYKHLKTNIERCQYPQFYEVAKKIVFTGFESILTNTFFLTVFIYPFFLCSIFLGKDPLSLAKKAKSRFKLLGRRYANFQASIGIAKLETLETQIEKVTMNVESLIEKLYKDVVTQKIDSHTRPIFYCFVISTKDRNCFYKMLIRKGIIGLTNGAQNCAQNGPAKEDCPIAKKISETLIQIPIYPQLSKGDINRIASTINTHH